MTELLKRAPTRTANRSSTPVSNAFCKLIQECQSLWLSGAIDAKRDRLKVKGQVSECYFLHRRIEGLRPFDDLEETLS